MRVIGMLVGLHVPVAFQRPHARLWVGRDEDLGLFVWNHFVIGGVDHKEWHAFCGEHRGLPFRYHLLVVEIGEDLAGEQYRRLEHPAEAYEFRDFSSKKEREVAVCGFFYYRGD